MYTPHTKKDKEEMLKTIGASSFEDLVKQVPAKFLWPKLSLPAESLDESQAAALLTRLAGENCRPLSFLGAGAYERYTPAAIKAITSRTEFLTAYTPYQPEASQGTLQGIYEFQSTVCALYDMDCANASMYDGASSFAEAVRAAVRVTGRKKIVYAAGVNPQYMDTLRTYFAHSPEYTYVKIPMKDGAMDKAALPALLEGAACIAAQTPNFLGLIEDMSGVAEAAKKAGALLVVSADPVSLGLLSTPGEYGADFAVGEGQSLGLPLAYGGPYLGIFSCKKEYVRQMPGRIAGLTKDKDGKRGFVLTLQAREQHIRRDKAASNICSNEALCALAATVYSALYGPEGLKELAEANSGAAAYAAERLSSIKGVSLKFRGPFFNEFVVSLPVSAGGLREKILATRGVDIGLPLAPLYPELGETLLVCATETKTEADILKLEAVIKEAL
ncbi:MAG: aminomethyl-transferring glycine dehydrogenase [Elusimicrobia bacterium CG_4_10_14_0_2_um_filter_56_8]|nr:MAG: glycine dehydrogenase (aminomethyl-transferring) [Elusimicrobia bacterium CG1_02_56_21]PJA13865.1 MAG: aminomethyl-transferring glycine dehydrogenase [Elusimicrobia bacterium CG_4_10_14_0_2_um_filter_56_8]